MHAIHYVVQHVEIPLSGFQRLKHSDCSRLTNHNKSFTWSPQAFLSQQTQAQLPAAIMHSRMVSALVHQPPPVIVVQVVQRIVQPAQQHGLCNHRLNVGAYPPPANSTPTVSGEVGAQAARHQSTAAFWHVLAYTVCQRRGVLDITQRSSSWKLSWTQQQPRTAADSLPSRPYSIAAPPPTSQTACRQPPAAAGRMLPCVAH